MDLFPVDTELTDWFWNSTPTECTLEVLLEGISMNGLTLQAFSGPVLDLRGLSVEEHLDCTDYGTIGVALGERNTVISRLHLGEARYGEKPECINHFLAGYSGVQNSTLTSLDISDSYGLLPETYSHLASLTNIAMLNMRESTNFSDSAGINSDSDASGAPLSVPLHAYSFFARLKTLNLSQNIIGDNGLEFLQLESNTMLVSLDLSTTDMSLHLVKSIANSLSTNSTLTDLKISNNCACADEGATEIANALKQNRGIKVLLLAQCSIRGRGAEALADSLYTNNCLQRLSLKDNLVTSDGVEAFARVLASNVTLTELNMVRTDARAGWADAIVKVGRSLMCNPRPFFNIAYLLKDIATREKVLEDLGISRSGEGSSVMCGIRRQQAALVSLFALGVYIDKCDTVEARMLASVEDVMVIIGRAYWGRL